VTYVVEVVSVTKKGQATIPKKLRKKYGIKDKVLVEDNGKEITIKPLPTPDDAYGSLKSMFKGKTVRELLEEARKEEFAQDEKWTKRARAANL